MIRIITKPENLDLKKLRGRRKLENIGDANEFFGAAPYFDVEILGVLKANIFTYLKKYWIGSAIAPPAPPVPSPL